MQNQIAEYDNFRSGIAALVKENILLTFDYESNKGEKEARSYICKLSQTKAAVEAMRKEIKSPALERCRLIDSEANKLIGIIEMMIMAHTQSLEEKAERELQTKQLIIRR